MKAQKNLLTSPILCAALLAVSLMTLPGCLKSRAQLKEDGEPTSESSEARPVQVKEVQSGGYAVEELKSEFTRLTGRVDELEQSQKQNKSSDEIKRLEQRIVELEQGQLAALEAIKKIQTQPSVTETADELESGKTQFKVGNWEGAIEHLSNYIKSPKAKNLEEATYLRAEAYFESKQFKKAIIDYSKFPEKFTTSKRMPMALLKIGQSFDALGLKDDAQGFYQELKEKFPKSPEAKLIKPKGNSRLR
jgi:TolA-binding protein